MVEIGVRGQIASYYSTHCLEWNRTIDSSNLDYLQDAAPLVKKIQDKEEHSFVDNNLVALKSPP